MLNNTQALHIFAKESYLFGDTDGLPLYRAEEIFGVDAVRFAIKKHTENKFTYDAYDIGNYTVEYLTFDGVQEAITYNLKLRT